MTEKLRVGVLASGGGTNLQAIIDASEAGEISAEVVVVISDCDDAHALVRAAKFRIANFCYQPKEFETRDDLNHQIRETLDVHNVGLVVMAGYMRLLGREVLSAYENRVLNIHPALLPSFPGAHGVRDALDYGVKVAGLTVHFASEEFDEGPVIFQEAVPVYDDDTEETLHNRIHELEYRLYPLAVKYYALGRLKVEGRKVRIQGDWDRKTVVK